MEKILFVNACVRENSRTSELAKVALNKLGGRYDEVNLQCLNLQALNRESLEKRENLVQKGDFSDDMFAMAKAFAAADTVVIAAPYWDLSFPAILKIYLEQITVCKVTFEYRKGIPHGLCRAKRLIYITSSGGKIHFNLGFEYVKTIAEEFFSIPTVLCFSAEELDVNGADVEAIMAKATEHIEGELTI